MSSAGGSYEYEWDEGKAAANLAKHGVDFAKVYDFSWTAVIEDNRKDYGEPRFIAVGLIGTRLYVLCFTLRGKKVRVISLRKANERERKLHYG